MSKAALTILHLFLFFFCLFTLSNAFAATGCAVEETLINNNYLGACGYASYQNFTLSQEKYVTRIRVWFYSGSYNLGGGDDYFELKNSSGNAIPTTISGGGCQGYWCERFLTVNAILPAGTYKVEGKTSNICSNPSGQTTLVVYGCNASSSTPSSMMVTCDLNGDGKQDIVFKDAKGGVKYSTNLTAWTNVAGTLEKYIACGDLNGDGKADIIGANNDNSIWQTLNLGAKWNRIPGSLSKIFVSDFNGDGKADVLGLNDSGNMYVSYDLSTFSQVPGALSDISPGNFNAPRPGNEFVGINSNGHIYYTPDFYNMINVPGKLAKVFSGELNGDGRADLLGLNDKNEIFYTTNLSTWTYIPGSLVYMTTGDLDGNGKNDIVGFNNSNDIYYTTNFSTWKNIPGKLSNLLTGDLNGDKKADVVGIGGDGRVYYTTNLKDWNVVGEGASNPPSLTIKTNPTSSEIFTAKGHDGVTVHYYGLRDADGFPIKINNFLVESPNGVKTRVYLNENNLPSRLQTSDGVSFMISYIGNYQAHVTAVYPKESIIVSSDFKPGQKLASSYLEGEQSELKRFFIDGFYSANINPLMSFLDYRALSKATGEADWLIKVQRCGKPVEDAFMVWYNVTVPGWITAGPSGGAENIGGGFYRASIPTGLKPSFTVEKIRLAADKIESLMSGVCDALSMSGDPELFLLPMCPAIGAALATITGPGGVVVSKACSAVTVAVIAYCKTLGWSPDGPPGVSPSLGRLLVDALEDPELYTGNIELSAGAHIIGLGDHYAKIIAPSNGPFPTATIDVFDNNCVYINSINPKKGPAETVVTIKGSGFGTNKDNRKVTFNGIKTAAARWYDGFDEVEVKVPKNAKPGINDVVVDINGITSAPSHFEVTTSCNSQQVAGSDTPDTRTIELGKTSGSFSISYETYTVKDQIIVRYEGKILHDSGCVGTNGFKTVNLSYNGNSSQITVQVAPNCAGETGTQWVYNVTCP